MFQLNYFEKFVRSWHNTVKIKSLLKSKSSGIKNHCKDWFEIETTTTLSAGLEECKGFCILYVLCVNTCSVSHSKQQWDIFLQTFLFYINNVNKTVILI